MVNPVATPVATFDELDGLLRFVNQLPLGQTLSGWRDLNSRPLDPQIGCPWLSSLNHLSLVSVVDR